MNSPSALSKSIPIAKSLKRTASELQLTEDEAMADFRDYCMYTRIVNGISYRDDSTEALNSIVRTRHLPIRETSCRSDQEDFIKYAIFPLEPAASRISYPFSHEQNQQSMIPDPEVEERSPEEEGIFVMDL
jgi:hypothetical protein